MEGFSTTDRISTALEVALKGHTLTLFRWFDQLLMDVRLILYLYLTQPTEVGTASGPQ